MSRLVLALLLSALFLAPFVVRAEERSPHQLSAYLRTGGSLFLSDSRTMGGFAGGAGVRDVYRNRLVLQADLSYLTMMGHVGEARLGVGVQHSVRAWTPGATVTGTLLFGQKLAYRSETQPKASTGPAAALGVDLSPLRFCSQDRCVSLLDLGVGYGTDGVSGGMLYRVGLMELGVRF